MARLITTKFNPKKYDDAHANDDWILKMLKDSGAPDADLAYLLAVCNLALATEFPKAWKRKALQDAIKKLKQVMPSKTFRCRKCGLVGHFPPCDKEKK